MTIDYANQYTRGKPLINEKATQCSSTCGERREYCSSFLMSFNGSHRERYPYRPKKCCNKEKDVCCITYHKIILCFHAFPYQSFCKLLYTKRERDGGNHALF